MVLEPRSDMLPDPSQTEPEVSEDLKTPAPAPAVPEDEPTVSAPAEPQRPPKGYVPHEALLEERRLRKEAQAKLKSLESSSAPLEETEETVAEVEDVTEPSHKVASLEAKIKRLEQESLLRQPQYAAIADKRAEFEDYLEENSELPLEKAAKLFLLENDLLPVATSPERKGLEAPTAGVKTPPSSGYTLEQVKKIREEQPRLYIRLLREGKIDLDAIK